MKPTRFASAAFAALLPILFLAPVFPAAGADPAAFRIWKNTEGAAIEARLVERKSASVVLEMRNAKRYEVPLAKLSPEDVEWMDRQESAARKGEMESHGLAIEPLMARPGRLLFEDSLREIAEGWSAGNGEWTIVDGALQGKELAADDHAATFKRKLAFKDAIIQYSFKLDGAKATTFSVNDSVDHVCRVSINEAGFTTQKDDHDHEGPDLAVRFHTRQIEISPGEWHTILIEIKDDTLVAQVDGEYSFGSHELIGEVEKASIGFTISGESVQFKDLRIWEALPREDWEATRKKLERRMD